MAKKKTDTFDADKFKTVNDALEPIWAKYGHGEFMLLNDLPVVLGNVIPTGDIAIDKALGVGGIPRGRVIEVFGPESSGKTTLTLEVVAQAQAAGDTCAFIDAEHALDPIYAQDLGVKMDQLYISQPTIGERALEMVRDLCKTGQFGLIVVDSVPALTPKQELEGELTDANVGVRPRMMSKALSQIASFANETNTTVIMVNQIREKIGVLFGSPEVTPGGRALKFYSSVRIDIRRREAVKDGDLVTGNLTDVKIIKNKVAPPFRTAEVELVYGKGFNRERSLLLVGVEVEVVGKSGHHYISPDGTTIANGLSNSAAALAEDPLLADEIEAAIREKLWPAE